MRTKFTILALMTLIITGTARADSGGGTTSPFVLGAGSRELALAGSNIAACDMGAAAFWNQAMLSHAEQYQVTGLHARLFESDVTYQYVGIVAPTLDWGVIGASLFSLGINEIEKRDNTNVLLGTFDDSRLALRLAYGRMFSQYEAGVALQLEHQSLENYSATSTPALDISIMRSFKPISKWCRNLKGALVWHNVLKPSLRLADESVTFPWDIQFGIASEIGFDSKRDHILNLSGKFSKVEDLSIKTSVGAEYGLFEKLKLRAGWQDGNFSSGAGVAYRGISFDYAVVSRDLGDVHFITASTSFGKPVSERRSLRSEQREAEFTQNMSRLLIERNQTIVSDLIRQGRGQLEIGEVAQASGTFDKALFLARSSDLDTTEIQGLVLETQKLLLDLMRDRQLTAYLDSASLRLASNDYLAAQYYAGLALEIDSTSAAARELKSQAQAAYDQLSSQKEYVELKLQEIDSLLSYGRLEEAMIIAQALRELETVDKAVSFAVRKVEFERLRSTAGSSYKSGEYNKAVNYLDSALSIFPEHNWCVALRDSCYARLNQPKPKPVASTPMPTLSRQLLKEVESRYQQAREAFSRGELQAAIYGWEEVERLAPDYESVRDYLVKAYRYVGVDLYGQNHLREAMVIWNKALKLAPDNPEIKSYAQRTQREIDKLKELTYDQ